MVQRWLCSFQNVSLQIFLPPHFNEFNEFNRLHVNDTGRVLHIPNQHLRSKVPLNVKIVIFDLDDEEIPFFET